MDNTPLVSVVIPFLNAGPWLRESVQSVIAQTDNRWELLLVDDGSVREDGELAKSYAVAYPDKIFYLQHEGHANKGVAVSRNKGIAAMLEYWNLSITGPHINCNIQGRPSKAMKVPTRSV